MKPKFPILRSKLVQKGLKKLCSRIKLVKSIPVRGDSWIFKNQDLSISFCVHFSKHLLHIKMFSGWGLLWTFLFSTMKYSTLQIAPVDWPRWILIRHFQIFYLFAVWLDRNACIENISGSIWRRHCGVGHIVRGVLQGQHSHHAGTLSQLVKDSHVNLEFNKEERKKVQSLKEKLNLSDSQNFSANTDRWSSNLVLKYWLFYEYQLLRDNLTLWTSDMQGEGEEKPAEGDFSIYFYQFSEKQI